MGYMSGETYPFGLVYIMTDGSLSPVFPIQGCDIRSLGDGTLNHVYSSSDNNKGLVTFPFHHQKPVYDSTNLALKVKSVTLNLNTLATDPYILENTLGFFVVRGERRPNAITQGVLLPTIKAPTIEAAEGGNLELMEIWGANTNTDNSDAGGYYVKNGSKQDDTNVFKHLINLDSLIEAFAINDYTRSYDRTVVNENGAVAWGYLPVYMRESPPNYFLDGDPVHPYVFRSKSNSNLLRHWGFISGEALMNEAEFITALQRDGMGVHQIAKLLFNVESEVTPIMQPPAIFYAPSRATFGCHYNMIGYSSFYTSSNKPTLKSVKRTVYVPAESLATGTDFISKMKVALFANPYYDDESGHFLVNQWYNSYFGIQIADSDTLSDATPGANNPIGGDSRPGKRALSSNEDRNVDARMDYSNLGRQVPAAFLVNVYPQGTVLSPDDLYQSVDSVVYKQASQRYTWADAQGIGYQLIVFGGDCYISKVSRKLNHAPVRNASTVQTEEGLRYNIDSGLIISWWQESKYNLHLRQPKQYDTTELEKRSFFPYQSLGDPIGFRKYRLPETKAHSLGYSVMNPPKSFFGVSSLVPFEQTRFMNRIYHSEKHVPNVFRNGYRSFLETSFRDYDAGMGSIVALFNHRGNLLVVFEHGIGITSVEQRVETGGDAGGAVFLEASVILPPTLTYLSREIGCQDNLSLVQTPGAVYGMDRAKDKIWRVEDGLKVISDEDVSSWLISNPLVSPRAGYDFEYNEVLFTTDNWCLCFLEGLNKWTSFYTYTDGRFFARRNKELYSFIGKTAHRHNIVDSYTIYGSPQNVIVEVIMNKAFSMAKVLDYIELISNEVAPVKVEVYSYNQTVEVGASINPVNLNQYTFVDEGLDPITEEERIFYRDKKYVVQIPYRKNYNTGSDVDSWGLEGRLRDKSLIVRLTYQPEKPLELVTILNYFRYSPS
jgi:hypothetical protein